LLAKKSPFPLSKETKQREYATRILEIIPGTKGSPINFGKSSRGPVCNSLLFHLIEFNADIKCNELIKCFAEPAGARGHGGRATQNKRELNEKRNKNEGGKKEKEKETLRRMMNALRKSSQQKRGEKTPRNAPRR
jgi:hypothetical protein